MELLGISGTGKLNEVVYQMNDDLTRMVHEPRCSNEEPGCNGKMQFLRATYAGR